MNRTHIIAAILFICIVSPLSAQPTWKYMQRGIKTKVESLGKSKSGQPASASEANNTKAIRTSAPLTDRFVAMKSNIAYYAGAVANLGAEIQVGRHFSLDLPVNLSLWEIEREHGFRLVLFQPEARYWFGEAGYGHFLGLHAHAAGFNIKWQDTRYQSKDLPLLGAGLSYGYSARLSDNWNFEFTLGAGYAYIEYDTFYNIDNGAQTGSGIYNYWGLTRLGLSFVYKF